MQVGGAIKVIEESPGTDACVCGNMMYDKGGMLDHNSSVVVGQLDIHMRKMLDLYNIPHTKINSR